MAESNTLERPTHPQLNEIVTRCIQMVHDNKVSQRNAFELKLLEHLPDVVDSLTASGADAAHGIGEFAAGLEHRFHEASCSLEACAKIYERRVDAVHTSAYTVWSGLHVQSEDDQPGGNLDGSSTFKSRRWHINTLERNEANITAHRIEREEHDDPEFHRMAAAFDANGAQGLLLNKLPIADDLSLVFSGEAPLRRAAEEGASMLSRPRRLDVAALGLGDPGEVLAELTESPWLLCPEIDAFRYELFGNVPMDVPPLQLGAARAVSSTAKAAPVPCCEIAVASKQQSQSTLDRWVRKRLFRTLRKRLWQKTKVGILLPAATPPSRAQPVIRRRLWKKTNVAATATAHEEAASRGSQHARVDCKGVGEEPATFDDLFANFLARSAGEFARWWTEKDDADLGQQPSVFAEVPPSGLVSTPPRAGRPKRDLPCSGPRGTPKRSRIGRGTAATGEKDGEQKSTLWAYCKSKKEQPPPLQDITYSRDSRFVNVRRVKNNMFDCIRDDGDFNLDCDGSQTERSSFRSLVDRTVRRMPAHEAENTSLAMCFITLLHLCNEKGLELQSGQSSVDLEVVRRSDAFTSAAGGDID